MSPRGKSLSDWTNSTSDGRPLGRRLHRPTNAEELSRLVAADVAALATVIAWTIAGLTVWSVTRMLRTFFDTLLRKPFQRPDCRLGERL